jgi:hypothetical protein
MNSHIVTQPQIIGGIQLVLSGPDYVRALHVRGTLLQKEAESLEGEARAIWDKQTTDSSPDDASYALDCERQARQLRERSRVLLTISAHTCRECLYVLSQRDMAKLGWTALQTENT